MSYCCFVCGGASQVHPLQAGDEADHAGEIAASRYRVDDSLSINASGTSMVYLLKLF